MNLEITNKENPITDFRRIAEHLMNECILIVGDGRYRFTELEFYYFNKAKHADEYSHKHKMQQKKGYWYFHGSGLDITFGDQEFYDGILIRSIKNLKIQSLKESFINGPIVCIQALFSNFGPIDTSNKFDFCIKEAKSVVISLDKEEVYSCSRVGIDEIKDATEDKKFHKGYFRFLIYPRQSIAKKNIAADDFLSQGMEKEKINDLLYGYKHFK